MLVGFAQENIQQGTGDEIDTDGDAVVCDWGKRVPARRVCPICRGCFICVVCLAV